MSTHSRERAARPTPLPGSPRPGLRASELGDRVALPHAGVTVLSRAQSDFRPRWPSMHIAAPTVTWESVPAAISSEMVTASPRPTVFIHPVVTAVSPACY